MSPWACSRQFCECGVGFDCLCCCERVATTKRCGKCHAKLSREEEPERTVLDSILDREPPPEEPTPVPVLPGQKRLFE